MRPIPHAFAVIALLLFVNLNSQEKKTVKTNGKLVANSAEDICPLLVGEKIPRLKLRTPDGSLFDLNESISKKPTLLIFYRGGWCPYCNMHLAEIRTIEDSLTEMGYQIIAISADRFEKLDETVNKHQMKYTLLSDNEALASKAFGLAFRVSNENVEELKGYNMDIEEASGNEAHILPVPAAFIVGTGGIIKFAYVNRNYQVRVKADLILAAAKAEMDAATVQAEDAEVN